MSFTLSKSAVNTYLKCPREFKYQYKDRKPVKKNLAMQMGNEIHDIAKNFIRLWQEDDSIDILETLLEFERRYDEDYSEHCRNLAAFFKGKLIDEKYSVFIAEEKLYSEKYDFVGYADIVLEKDGELTVIDYKTGKAKSVHSFIRELSYYRMIIEDKFPDKKVKYAGIFFTEVGEYDEVEFTDEDYSSIHCSKTEYENQLKLLEEVRKNIDLGHFEPKRQALCKNCNYKGYCDRDGFL